MTRQSVNKDIINEFEALLKKHSDYIHEYVIDRAKDLLIGTTEPISQIGYKLGFEYPTHFSKFFKKKTGITPSKFRL